MFGELVPCFFLDQQMDEGQSLCLIARFRQQSAIAIVIIFRAGTRHGPILDTQAVREDRPAIVASAQGSDLMIPALAALTLWITKEAWQHRSEASGG